MYIYTPIRHEYRNAYGINKWYPQRCLLAHFEATLDFRYSEFTCT